MGRIILVTGGARSGKSRFAEARALEIAPDPPRLYVATAEPLDEEMRTRIERHRESRSGRFRTVEAPRELAGALRRELEGAKVALVDCVTLWLSNRMLAGESDESLLAGTDDLIAAARAASASLILVTNELGAGVVPENALARRFRDLAGLVNQRLGAAADEAYLIACGLPLRLSG